MILLVAVLKRSQSRTLRPLLRFSSSISPQALPVKSQLYRRLASTISKAAAPKNAPAAPGTKYKYPERLQLYHAGVSRITFLACVKLTTIILSAFFIFVVTPNYYAKEGWSPTTLRIALSGVVPLVFVAWTTSPFVLLVTTRLPPFARTSEEHLRRYLAKLPADAVFGITTMSPIAKPRTSKVVLSELRQTSQRLGIVNYCRDASADNALRKWYHFRAVDKFSIQTNKTKDQLWYWDSVTKFIPKDKP